MNRNSTTSDSIHPIWIAIRVIVTVICGVIIVITVAGSPGGDPYRATSWKGTSFTLAGFVLFVYWVAVGTHWVVNKFIWPNVETAITPIPSPVEIELQLRREGYDPTLQDVAAVHQMLSSRRNEAAVAAGLTLGAAYLMHRNLQGK
jgi:hypothetical protein